MGDDSNSIKDCIMKNSSLISKDLILFLLRTHVLPIWCVCVPTYLNICKCVCLHVIEATVTIPFLSPSYPLSFDF